MASEDVLPQVFAEIYNKANPDPPSDNQQLNKIEVPNDILTVSVSAQTYVAGASVTQDVAETLKMSSAATATAVDTTTLGWGGIDNSGVLEYGGWDWGVGGAWG